MENVYIEVIQPVLQSIFRYCIYVLAFVVVALIAYLVKRYVIPFLREKLGEERFDALTKYVRLLMCTAEQKFQKAASGLSKSEYVISLVKKKFPDLDESYIQTVIDGLMRPLTAEGCVNVGNGEDIANYISAAVNQAMADAREREKYKNENETNPNPFAPGTETGETGITSDPEEPPQNPDPEALDAPPID